MYGMTCENKCYDDKIENNFYEQKNEEDRQVLIDIATAFSDRYFAFKKAQENNEHYQGGDYKINDILAFDEGNYVDWEYDEKSGQYIKTEDTFIGIQIFWNDFNILDINIYDKTYAIRIRPQIFFQVPFHLFVNGSYLTELKKHIAEKTGCENIEIDVSYVDDNEDFYIYGTHYLYSLKNCLDDDFGGSLEPAFF